MKLYRNQNKKDVLFAIGLTLLGLLSIGLGIFWLVAAGWSIGGAIVGLGNVLAGTIFIGVGITQLGRAFIPPGFFSELRKEIFPALNHTYTLTPTDTYRTVYTPRPPIVTYPIREKPVPVEKAKKPPQLSPFSKTTRMPSSSTSFWNTWIGKKTGSVLDVLVGNRGTDAYMQDIRKPKNFTK